MNPQSKKKSPGFSLVELMIAMTVMLIALSIVSSLLARAWSVRSRESRTADALASAQAAIDVLSREISNSGFGLTDDSSTQLPASNGLVLADCNANKIRFRANIENEGGTFGSNVTSTHINRPGEDVTYFFDSATQSIVRYDPNGFTTDSITYQPLTSVVVNKVSNVTFAYYNYAGSTSASTLVTTPTNDTGRIRITVDVQLEQVAGQVNPQTITFSSDVTLRNNSYMLKQY